MKDPIEFMRDALNSMMKPGKIIIEKEEGSLEVKTFSNTDDNILLGMMLMETMTKIANRSEMHKFSIASAVSRSWMI